MLVEATKEFSSCIVHLEYDGYEDCGGLSISSFNMPIAKNHIPGIIVEELEIEDKPVLKTNIVFHFDSESLAKIKKIDFSRFLDIPQSGLKEVLSYVQECFNLVQLAKECNDNNDEESEEKATDRELVKVSTKNLTSIDMTIEEINKKFKLAKVTDRLTLFENDGKLILDVLIPKGKYSTSVNRHSYIVKQDPNTNIPQRLYIEANKAIVLVREDSDKDGVYLFRD